MAEEMLQFRSEWDAFVLENGGGFLQSEGWARFQEALGRKVWRMAESVQGEPAAKGVFVRLPLPIGGTYLYSPRGPVVSRRGGKDEAEFTRRFDVALAAMLAEARQGGDAFVRIEPEWTVDDAPMASGALLERGFRAGVRTQPDHTRVIDLTKSEDALLGAMHQKTRYNIRVAERDGVIVRSANADEHPMFTALMKLTTERDGFVSHEDAYYETQLQVLSGDGPGLRARLWIAEIGGRPAAAAITAEFGATVTYLHGASDSSLRKHMAPLLLHWRIITDAKRRGLARYDLWGTAPSKDGVDDEKHPWAGITRFKKGFGGVDEAYVGAWELPGRKTWYRLYRGARALRKLF